MPAQGMVLYSLIRKNVDEAIKKLNGEGPIKSLTDPKYFEEMCKSLGMGIALGSTAISFTTHDIGLMSAPPIPALAGTGVGIVVQADYMTEQIYTKIRDKILSSMGKTTHDPYPPKAGNSGEFLLAIASGVAKAVKEHFATAMTLTSTHPIVYMGNGAIAPGDFSGLVPDNIKSLILNNSPQLKGDFWPTMAGAIAEGYADGIHKRSSGVVSITGICIPTPIPPLVCGLPGTGTGSGVAS
jgi:hypothetical protein